MPPETEEAPEKAVTISDAVMTVSPPVRIGSQSHCALAWIVPANNILIINKLITKMGGGNAEGSCFQEMEFISILMKIK